MHVLILNHTELKSSAWSLWVWHWQDLNPGQLSLETRVNAVEIAVTSKAKLNTTVWHDRRNFQPRGRCENNNEKWRFKTNINVSIALARSEGGGVWGKERELKAMSSRAIFHISCGVAIWRSGLICIGMTLVWGRRRGQLTASRPSRYYAVIEIGPTLLLQFINICKTTNFKMHQFLGNM